MSNEGSLLRLFNHEGFKLEMLLEYLYKKDEPGVLTYLINKLYNYPSFDYEFYIPQLLNLYFYKQGCSDLERVLLQASIDSHSFALKLHFNLIATLGDCLPEHKERSQIFLENLDMVIVNAVMPKQTSESPPPNLYSLESNEDEINSFNRKTIRSDYYNYQIKIINLLCKISVGLTMLPLDQRDSQLRTWLTTVEAMISDTRNSHLSSSHFVKKLFRGPIINFKFNYDIDLSVSQIVRVLPDKSFCFCTKARVPYKMLMETIELNEDEQCEGNVSAKSFDEGKISDLIGVDVESIKKMVDKFDRFEGYSEYVEQAEQNEGQEINSHTQNNQDQSNPYHSVWGELWEDLSIKIRETSPFGKYSTWKLRGLIVKGLDDLRQEYLAMQFITKIKKIWEDAYLSLYLRPYEIKIVSNYMGLIEFIPNTLSLHAIKKTHPNYTTLEDFFIETWPNTFEEAQRNFIQSMAGYSLVSYLLNIKDRHNANILLDSSGHIIHIDFGFLFTNSPGGNIGFESAPFKLNSDMIGVMGGLESEMFHYYKILLLQGFLEVRKYASELTLILEMIGPESNLPCLRDFNKAVMEFKDRLQLTKTDEKCITFVESLVYNSQNNWRTAKYDEFQYLSNGIL